MLEISLVVMAYLVGSLSAAIITCKAMGLADPRTEVSRKPGATNVMRIGGKKAAAITLFGDMAKGLIPVLIASALDVSNPVLAAVGLSAFLGHLYPLFFGFQGGKGVATALGVLLGISWPAALAILATWVITLKLFKISSLSALTASVTAPLFMWLLEPQPVFFEVTMAISILLIWRHRGNIQRLMSGTEGKV